MSTESHVYNEDGDLQGLFLIDGVEARKVYGNKRFWEGVDEIVRLYTELNPNEMQGAVVENASIRTNNLNRFGGNESKSMRQALNIPYGLYLPLLDYEKTLFRNKKTREAFMKRYPHLRSCDTV